MKISILENRVIKFYFISGLLLFLFTCRLVHAEIYYVSTTGSDSNSGTSIGYPFLTLSKPLSLIVPGDKIFVRGGLYLFSSGISISKSGTQSDSCFLLAYPGERPILDFSGTSFGTRGISLTGSYWKIKGFDIRKAGDNGLYISKGGHNLIEFCSFYENSDSGLQLGGGTSDNRIINCDSYYNADPPDYGDADGFAGKLDVGTNNYFCGCRSWLNVDDGWDGYLRGSDDVSTTLENCWTWRNGYFKNGTDAGPNANGNGFKMGGSDDKLAMHNFTLKNCVSFDNKAKGFDQNNNKGSMYIYNCSGYRNGGNNFSVSQSLASGKILEVKNCVAADGRAVIAGFAVQSTNSWMAPFIVSSDDFITLDTLGVSGPRKSDGSLPHVSFMHLKQGSDLIDSGSDVGLPFLGKAPDLGAFEYSGTTGIKPVLIDFNPVQAYPNPVHDFLVLKFQPDYIIATSVSLVNMNGKIMWEIRAFESGFTNSEILVNLSEIKNGVYLIVAEGSSWKWIKRIIKL